MMVILTRIRENAFCVNPKLPAGNPFSQKPRVTFQKFHFSRIFQKFRLRKSRNYDVNRSLCTCFTVLERWANFFGF